METTKKIRVGIVCYPTYGGSGVVATELGISLAKKGHEIHFISYRQPFRLDNYSTNIFFHEVTIPDYPLFDYAPYELNLTSKLVDVVMHENLDLLHVHYAIPHASAAVSAKNILSTYGINIPIITTLHGTDITLLGKDESFKPVIEYSINQSDAITAVSKDLILSTKKYFNIDQDINLIPNFIDVSLYKNKSNFELRKKFANKGEKLLVHVSNFRKVKRVNDVIRIFNDVNKRIPCKLLMIGDGPDRIDAEKLTRELNLTQNIRFVGKIKSVEKFLSISDIFLLTSESESFGLVALEALASSVPVISTNQGGINEVNINGATGYLFNVGDIKNMSKKCIEILSDSELLKELRDNSLIHAKNFDIKNIVPMYENLYDNLT